MEVSNRQRRIELNQIATIHRTGEVYPHKSRTPSEAEISEMRRWWEDWQARREKGELCRTEQFMEQVAEFTNWMTKDAPQEEVDRLSDDLLMSLLDLRQTVVRRLSQQEAGDTEAS